MICIVEINLFLLLFLFLLHCADKDTTKGSPSYLWILGLVVGLLLLSLGGILVYRKLKGKDGLQLKEKLWNNNFTALRTWNILALTDSHTDVLSGS